MRTMILGTLAGLLLTGPATAQQEAAASSACARLAPQLKMKRKAPPRGSSEPVEWRVNILGGLGTALFGGAAAASLSVEPIDDAEVTDYGAFAKACTQERTNMTCRATGPARLRVATNKVDTAVDLAPGEKVEAGLRDVSNIYCRDVG